MIIEQEKQICCCVYLPYDIVSVDTWLSMPRGLDATSVKSRLYITFTVTNTMPPVNLIVAH
jgi:hypothetical protein